MVPVNRCFTNGTAAFLEAGKKRLAGDTTREATSEEVADLRKEHQKRKEMVVDLMLKYGIVKKSLQHLG